MLIVTRFPGESIAIGDNITITIIQTNGQQAQLGIKAPKELIILREELLERRRHTPEDEQQPL